MFIQNANPPIAFLFADAFISYSTLSLIMEVQFTDKMGRNVKSTETMRRILWRMCTKHQAPEAKIGHGVLKPHEHFKTKSKIEDIIKEEAD